MDPEGNSDDLGEPTSYACPRTIILADPDDLPSVWEDDSALESRLAPLKREYISQNGEGNLCAVCASVFQEGLPAQFDVRRGIFIRDGQHQPTLHGLSKSAQEGCVICSSIWNRILDTATDDKLSVVKANDMDGDEDSDEEEEEDGRDEGNTNDAKVLKYSLQARDPNSFLLSVIGAGVGRVFRGFAVDEGPLDTIQLDSSTDSSTSLTLMNHWIENCKTCHTSCGYNNLRNDTQYDQQWYPRRLLWFSPDPGDEGGLLKLIETALMPPTGPYVTLSHCWGGKDIIKLTRASYDKFSAGIRLTALPLTFRDAVKVARHMSVTYIWIDSLCIIQDSDEDRDREISQMGQVYVHTFCTIAASHAHDSNGGLFSKRTVRALAPCFLRVPQKNTNSSLHEMRLFRISDTKGPDAEVDSSPLNRRGWVLQERMLSPRIIHFGRTQLYWECDSLLACEMYPLGAGRSRPFWTGSPRTSAGHTRSLIIPRNNTGNSAEVVYQTALWHWARTITAYTSTSLTVETDKLPAISGIAKYFGQIMQDSYLAGLWERHLIFQLGWRSMGNGNLRARQTIYRAPSWSWASVDHQVCPTVEISDECNQPVARVLQAAVTVRGTDQTGPAKEGFVRLQGFVHHVLIPKEGRPPGYSTMAFCNGELIPRAHSEVDTIQHEPLVSNCYAIVLSQHQHSDWNLHENELRILLLIPVSDKGKYQRYGLCRYFWSDERAAYSDEISDYAGSLKNETRCGAVPCEAFDPDLGHTIVVV